MEKTPENRAVEIIHLFLLNFNSTSSSQTVNQKKPANLSQVMLEQDFFLCNEKGLKTNKGMIEHIVIA